MSRVSASAAHASGHAVTHFIKIPINPFYEFTIDEKAAEAEDGPLIKVEAGGMLIVILAMASDALRPAAKRGDMSPKEREVYEVMVRSWKTLSSEEFLGLCVRDRQFKLEAALYIAMLFVADNEAYWKSVIKGESGARLQVCLALRRGYDAFLEAQKTMRLKRFVMAFSADSFHLKGVMSKEAAPDCGDPE